LGYTQWRRFEDTIKRAITSCINSGNEPSYHFAGAGKPIEGGKGAVQLVNDYHLSRFASKRIGGISPEHLPPAENIKLVEKRVKNVLPKLKLDGKDAKGLAGHSEEE